MRELNHSQDAAGNTGAGTRADAISIASGLYLTREQIRGLRPADSPKGRAHAMAVAKAAMQATGCFKPGQQMGQRWPVACIALEITQRCNLDCTLCYLSEHSEAVPDLPLEDIYRRIDAIGEHYGSGVDVQVTGGDPTLRKRDELIAIVRRLTDRGHRATLMTNGIKATKSLLMALREAGLSDVVFHVDTTQERRNRDGLLLRREAQLHHLRDRYISNARAAGLNVMFNTTVFDGNLQDIAELAHYFTIRADRIRTVSFQLQADTGRGVTRGRPNAITIDSIWARVQSGSGSRLINDATLVGHPSCSRYGLGVLVNGRLHDLFDEPDFIRAVQEMTAHVVFSRRAPVITALAVARAFAANPKMLVRAIGWSARKLRGVLMRPVARERGCGGAPRLRFGTLSFVIHNFMHTCALETERVDACVFKVMTRDGPLSMCVHNANRDAFILPVMAPAPAVSVISGLAASTAVEVPPPDPAVYGLKRTKGRTRARLLALRNVAGHPGKERPRRT